MKKTICYVGLGLACLLLILALAQPIPSKEISSYNFDGNGYEIYVGGDAYNIIIEAALRGGQISGATASRATYISGACILFLISGFGLAAEFGKKNSAADNLTLEEIPTDNSIESSNAEEEISEIVEDAK